MEHRVFWGVVVLFVGRRWNEGGTNQRFRPPAKGETLGKECKLVCTADEPKGVVKPDFADYADFAETTKLGNCAEHF